MTMLRPLFFVYLGVTVSVGKIPLFLKPRHHPLDTGPVNASIDPCANFYAYSCGPWISTTEKPPSEPVWSPWISTAYEIKRRLPKLLKSRDPILDKTRLFYQSCLSTNADGENKYLSDLISLVNELGGWPLVKDEWAGSSYDWLKHLSTITRLLGIHPMLKIHVDLDYKNPTQYGIYVEPGNLIFPQYILADSDRVVEMEAYEKWIEETVKHMYGNKTKRAGIKAVIKFETQLAKISETKSRNERMTVRRLSKKIPLKWGESLNVIFGGKQTNITADTIVMVKNYAYLTKLRDLIKTDGNRVVADYLIWSVVKELSRDTTEYMRKLNFLIDQAILGVTDDLSREHECTNKMIEFFSPTLLPFYLKTYVKPQTFKIVNSMFSKIKNAFINTLKKSQWLSEEARLLSAEKVKNIKLYLGFPRWFSKSGAIQRYYDKVKVGENHFSNVLRLKQIKMVDKVSRLSKASSDTLWPCTPFDVNAYYGILQNSVFIPLGLLQPPFFEPDRPPVYNYGALGSLIGHELSHSLDPTGIAADPTGKIRKWWPQNDLNLYKVHTKCFKYNEMIGENIADINGVKISLMAWDKLDPGRRTEQFFVSFAQMWCEIPGNSDIFTGDEHAPVSDRVENLNIIKDFGTTFRCDFKDVCELW